MFPNPLDAADQVEALRPGHFEFMRSISGHLTSHWLLLPREKVGWPLALNHFYEGNAANVLIAIIGTWMAWISIFGIVFLIFPYFNAVLKALRKFEGGSPRFEERPSLDHKRR